MSQFANRLSVTVGGIGGTISFILTFFSSFSAIGEFHGSFFQFLIYFLDGMGDSMLNAVMTFCICGIIAFPLLKILEYRMTKILREIEKKKEENNTENNKTADKEIKK